MTMSAPWEFAMRYDEMDISEISNSWKLSWRQKVSEGSEYVGISSTPSMGTVPSRIGSIRSFLPVTKLSWILAMAGGPLHHDNRRCPRRPIAVHPTGP